MNVKHDILFATVYTSVFFTLTKITANAQNLIFFYILFIQGFFSLIPIELYILLDFFQLQFCSPVVYSNWSTACQQIKYALDF